MKTAGKISQNLQKVQKCIKNAASRAKSQTDGVDILAVTKYASDQDVLALLQTGKIKHIGESRVQQALTRWTNPTFAKHHVYKHFIGHLQKNKAAQAAKLFDFIDSIDDIHTAQVLDMHAEKLNKKLFVMVQIKLTDRQTQSGLSLQEAPKLLLQLKPLHHLIVCGYMAIAPHPAETAQLRELFSQVKMAFDRDFPPGPQPRYLSLGMSEDFEIAVEEGSTLPRIGSMLFAENTEEV
ncbi:MAG: YggS family pyridoxal phosphate-dependent enzyme [Elusimicrobiaceae bacterium]|nr:YggS family pyridoxal phosphate-dependent enzyme [Elusimicrobiaceae bacterium]